MSLLKVQPLACLLVSEFMLFLVPFLYFSVQNWRRYVIFFFCSQGCPLPFQLLSCMLWILPHSGCIVLEFRWFLVPLPWFYKLSTERYSIILLLLFPFMDVWFSCPWHWTTIKGNWGDHKKVAPRWDNHGSAGLVALAPLAVSQLAKQTYEHWGTHPKSSCFASEWGSRSLKPMCLSTTSMGKPSGTSRNWDSPPPSLGISLGRGPESRNKIKTNAQQIKGWLNHVTSNCGNVSIDDPDLPDFFQDFSDFFWARVLTYSLRFYFGKAF